MMTVTQPQYRPYAVYHCWSYQNEPPIYNNLRTPVLLSIATLRAVSDIPIVVLDVSHPYVHAHQDWAHFPEKLGFRVENVYPTLEIYDDRVKGYLHLSRIPDIAYHIPTRAADSKTLMYVDTDVFFFRNPLPFHCDPTKFCFNGWNSGIFYYNFGRHEMTDFMEIFEVYTKAAIFSEDVRKVMKSFVGYDAWYGVWDEMILTYMLQNHRELFNIIPTTEHATSRNLAQVDLNKVKAFHSNGTMVANPISKIAGERDHCRGLLCLIVKEFYENICKVLDEKDLAMIFTDAERKMYLPQQFSLLERADRLPEIREEDGHYHIQKWLNNPMAFI